uniref:Lipoprotein n=1 Tax=Dulem virus 233 TaxID=3145710 RepID=A0AAU8AWM4_9VIRU
MKKILIVLLISFLSLVVQSCNSLSPYSQMAQPITTNTNLIYESDNASLSNNISSPSSTGGVTSNGQ